MGFKVLDKFWNMFWRDFGRFKVSNYGATLKVVSIICIAFHNYFGDTSRIIWKVQINEDLF